MIIVAGAPFSPQTLERGYRQQSAARLILREMSESAYEFKFDSEDELRFEIELRAATVTAAVRLHNSGMGFAVFRKSRCNTAFWERADNGGFIKRRGVLASDAIDDIFKNGPKYATECATAMVIVYYKALLTVFPTALFNKLFEHIELMNWRQLDPLLDGIGSLGYRDGFLPGDRLYFRNPDVNPQTPEWKGENVIMLGPDLYYGHGVGVTDAENIIKALNKNRVRGSTQSAYLIKRAGRPNFKKLFRIKNNYLERQTN